MKSTFILNKDETLIIVISVYVFNKPVFTYVENHFLGRINIHILVPHKCAPVFVYGASST